MSWFSKPKYSTVTVRKNDIPKDVWTKCPISGEIVYNKALQENWMVVPQSGYHFPLSAPERIRLLIDEGTFEEKDTTLNSLDPLKFEGIESYKPISNNNAVMEDGDAGGASGCAGGDSAGPAGISGDSAASASSNAGAGDVAAEMAGTTTADVLGKYEPGRESCDARQS